MANYRMNQLLQIHQLKSTNRNTRPSMALLLTLQAEYQRSASKVDLAKSIKSPKRFENGSAPTHNVNASTSYAETPVVPNTLISNRVPTKLAKLSLVPLRSIKNQQMIRDRKCQHSLHCVSLFISVLNKGG